MSLKVCWGTFFLLRVEGGLFCCNKLALRGAEIAFLYLLKGQKISEGIFQRAKLNLTLLVDDNFAFIFRRINFMKDTFRHILTFNY